MCALYLPRFICRPVCGKGTPPASTLSQDCVFTLEAPPGCASSLFRSLQRMEVRKRASRPCDLGMMPYRRPLPGTCQALPVHNHASGSARTAAWMCSRALETRWVGYLPREAGRRGNTRSESGDGGRRSRFAWARRQLAISAGHTFALAQVTLWSSTSRSPTRPTWYSLGSKQLRAA